MASTAVLLLFCAVFTFVALLLARKKPRTDAKQTEQGLGSAKVSNDDDSGGVVASMVGNSNTSGDGSGKQDKVRVVLLSDTHRGYGGKIPSGDILIHCGDSEWTAGELTDWAAAQPHAHTIAICGNMDSALARAHGIDKEKYGVYYLQDSAVTVRSLKIYGSPWTPEFVGVFQLTSDEQARAKWRHIPDDVDILVTHGPPKAVLDVTSHGRSVGDEALRDTLTERNITPRLHCFGHIHYSYGTTFRNGTLFCNAAVYDGHPPIVVDIPLDRKSPPVVVNDL